MKNTFERAHLHTRIRTIHLYELISEEVNNLFRWVVLKCFVFSVIALVYNNTTSALCLSVSVAYNQPVVVCFPSTHVRLQ